MKLRFLASVAFCLLPVSLACTKPAGDASAHDAASAPTPANDGAAATADGATAKAAGTCGATIDFKGNAAIESEIREELRQKDGPISPADLAKITNVNFIQATVDELDPCLFPLLTGARNLFLGRGTLSDLTPLAGLTQLNALQIAFDQVSDIKPLAKMTQMDRLDLEHTQVADLAPLANMKVLTQLQLDGTPVSDISALANCPLLEKLSLRETKVTDLSPLKDAKKLRVLYIEGAPVKDTSVLAALQKGGLKIVRKGRL